MQLHKRTCKCNSCYLIMRFAKKKVCDEWVIKRIIIGLQQMVVDSLNFKPQARGRFKGKRKISKEYKGDQYILVFEPEFHLKYCRRCKKIAHYPIARTRGLCTKCSNTLHDRSTPVLWGSWTYLP